MYANVSVLVSVLVLEKEQGLGLGLGLATSCLGLGLGLATACLGLGLGLAGQGLGLGLVKKCLGHITALYSKRPRGPIWPAQSRSGGPSFIAQRAILVRCLALFCICS